MLTYNIHSLLDETLSIENGYFDWFIKLHFLFTFIA